MTIPATTAPAQQQQAAPGQYFDVPGVPGGATQWTDEDETSTNVVTTHQTGAGQQIQGILPFRQTDVILDWQLWLGVSQTYTAGTSTLTISQQAPYNVIGRVQLVIQNQYASVDVESGYDLYIFSLVRPYNGNERRATTLLGSTGQPAGITRQSYLTMSLSAPAALNTLAYDNTILAYRLALRLPASQWFDEYYDLALTGEPTMQAHAAVVSPQYMAGTTRNIIPRIWVAPSNAGNLDQGPINIGDGTGTAAVSSTARFRRRGVYAGNQAVQPPVYAWQYRWKTERFAVGGRQRTFVIIPLDTGQLLFTYLRFWDPEKANGLGNVIALNNPNTGDNPNQFLQSCSLQYGSGLKWFDARTEGPISAYMLNQRLWHETHNFRLPDSIVAYDLAVDTQGNLSNKRALNTLTTAGIQHEVSFAQPLTPTTYAVLGTESLVYVS